MSAPGKKLRAGFTTGTAAAAAAGGAVRFLLEGKMPSAVSVRLPGGEILQIPILSCIREGDGRASCLVIKDAGDDPDVTHQAEIGARVRLSMTDPMGGETRVSVSGGPGVGRVTKPGLDVPPGGPAINPVPRRMIEQAVIDALRQNGTGFSVEAEIFVPKGEVLAGKTLNPRLGILGGISILGTTGIVKPLSHDAYTATIRSCLSVARAAGLDRAVLTTGRRSERFAMALWPDLPPEAFVQIGDYFSVSLLEASIIGIKYLILAVFFGKAVKMAQGVPHTHAAKSALTMRWLSEISRSVTRDHEFSDRILSANTARHALGHILEEHPEIVGHVGSLVVDSAQRFSGGRASIRCVVLGFEGGVIFDSDNRKDLP